MAKRFVKTRDFKPGMLTGLLLVGNQIPFFRYDKYLASLPLCSRCEDEFDWRVLQNNTLLFLEHLSPQNRWRTRNCVGQSKLCLVLCGDTKYVMCVTDLQTPKGFKREVLAWSA